jgi:hypothetical protein
MPFSKMRTRALALGIADAAMWSPGAAFGQSTSNPAVVTLPDSTSFAPGAKQPDGLDGTQGDPAQSAPSTARTDELEGTAVDVPCADATQGQSDASSEDAAAAAAPAALAAIPPNQREIVGEPTKVDMPSSNGNGSLTFKVDIDVVPFRGLEPSLSLTYDSSRKTKVSGLYQGWLGYAWGLSSFEVIERASFNFGMPVFDGTDTLSAGRPAGSANAFLKTPRTDAHWLARWASALAESPSLIYPSGQKLWRC